MAGESSLQSRKQRDALFAQGGSRLYEQNLFRYPSRRHAIHQVY